MSLFCSSSPSTTRPILSMLAPRQVLSFLYPIEFSRDTHSKARESSYRSRIPAISSVTGVETWFIKSLADAGSCHRHPQKPSRPTTFFTANRPGIAVRRRKSHAVVFQRHQHTDNGAEEAPVGEDVDDEPATVEELPPQPDPTRAELLALVDQYDGISTIDQPPIIHLSPRDASSGRSVDAGPEKPRDEDYQDEEPPPDYTWPADTETKIWLDELEIHLKELPDIDPQEIYEIYRALPEPRAPYLPPELRHLMLHHLSVVERKDENSMLRYLSVIDDMKRNDIPLTIFEWNSAISFVASYVNRITVVEVEAALQMWREMEHVSGIKANEATFNVLFDCACKAGKFVLAEMVYKEMETRGLPADRFHHVSLIFYYGLKKNASAARAAYVALVDAGEIVDTVVLNAMISALIRSSEPAAAEYVYEGMKKMHFGKKNPELPSKDWKKRRTVNNSLKHLAKKYGNPGGKTPGWLQANSVVSPDLQTYIILVNYCAVKAGDLESTARLLDEMKLFGLGLHGAMFFALFQGFAKHGGVRYSEWEEARLESVWASMLKSVDDGVEDIKLHKWLITWALYAFGKCAGKKRTLAAWEEIREKWTDPTEEDLDFVLGILRSILDGPDLASRRHDWVLGM